jgi:hypothetical protein
MSLGYERYEILHFVISTGGEIFWSSSEKISPDVEMTGFE